MFSSIYAKLGVGLAVLVAIGLAVFAIHSAIDKIDKQGQQIASLKTELETEKDARKRDVAGLTALSQGVVAAANAHAVDEQILAETIDAKNPKPSSPGLTDFLNGLRASDANRAAPAGPARAGPPARPGAAGPVRH
jgi:hypothetical protein